jgi:hypothetical protein
MGLIREPLDVDFTVDPRPLTKEEKTAISKYIRDYKMKATAKKPGLGANNKILTGKREQARH